MVLMAPRVDQVAEVVTEATILLAESETQLEVRTHDDLTANHVTQRRCCYRPSKG